jgi:hypothetical protein
MIDYSESLIKINYLRKKAHESILDKRWPDACDYLEVARDSGSCP